MKELTNNRYIKFDQIRVVAMLFVLSIHTIQFCDNQSIPYNSVWYVRQFLDTIFLTCNGMFFMLSGKFALSKILLETEYKKYYVKKIIKIIIPFFIVSFIYYFEQIITLKNYVILTDINWILDFLKKLIEGNIPNATHFWFVYVLIAIYLAAPFLSKIMKNSSDVELKILMYVIMIFQAFQVLSNIFSLNPATNYSYFGFSGWTSYFILGYVVDKLVISKKHRQKLFVLGAISFVLTLLQCRFLTNYCQNARNYSPLFIIITCSMYVLLRDYINKIPKILERSILFLAKYSFSFYLIHMLVIIILERHIKIPNSNLKYVIYFGIIYFLSLIISLIIAIILENIVFIPIENLIKKIFIDTKSSLYYKRNKKNLNIIISISLICVLSLSYSFWSMVNKPIIVKFPSNINSFIEFGEGWLDESKDEKYRWIQKQASFKVFNKKCNKIIIKGYVPENFKEVTSMKLLINDKIIYDNIISKDGFFDINEELNDLISSNDITTFTLIFNGVHDPQKDDLDIRTMSACISYIEID